MMCSFVSLSYTPVVFPVLAHQTTSLPQTVSAVYPKEMSLHPHKCPTDCPSAPPSTAGG